MYFILFSGNVGKVIIVEPDQESIQAYQRECQNRRLKNTLLVPTAAWSETCTLRIYINDAHPASNFIEGTKDYDENRMQEYRLVEVLATSIDHILEQNQIQKVDLISITTNGFEQTIIKGMTNTIANGLPYIALARTGEGYLDMMKSIGYELYTYDDRGFTFLQKNILTKQELDTIL